MEKKAFSMQEGWLWFVHGWEMFKKSPVLLIVAAFIWMALEVSIALIPVAGEVIDALLFPFLYAGFLFGARELYEERRLSLTHLFRGFTEGSKIKHLLTLGLLLAVAAIVEAGFVFLLGPVGAIFMAAPLAILVFSALLYSVPLVMFTDAEPVEAIKSSYRSCGQNIAALIVVYLVLLVFAIFTAGTLGLALLFIMPVTFLALYKSYKDIYG
jgi:uncharacterized membrane protein